jgi:hypothetical protein
MPFKKGRSGNINGRPTGTPNKFTHTQREFIESILDKQKDKIESELDKLQGKDYLNAITGLFEYVLPKLSRSEMRTDFTESENPVQIIQLPHNNRDNIEEITNKFASN